MFVSLHEEPAGAGGGIENHFAELGIDRLNDHAHQGSWMKNSTLFPRCVPHLLKTSTRTNG